MHIVDIFKLSNQGRNLQNRQGRMFHHQAQGQCDQGDSAGNGDACIGHMHLSPMHDTTASPKHNNNNLYK